MANLPRENQHVQEGSKTFTIQHKKRKLENKKRKLQLRHLTSASILLYYCYPKAAKQRAATVIRGIFFLCSQALLIFINPNSVITLKPFHSRVKKIFLSVKKRNTKSNKNCILYFCKTVIQNKYCAPHPAEAQNLASNNYFSGFL